MNAGINVAYAVAMMASVTASAMPCSPRASGCSGAVLDSGSFVFAQRNAGVAARVKQVQVR